MSFEGRVALVTGGGSGLGRAIALALAGAGARVVVAGRRPEKLEEARAAAGRAGAVTTRRCDVTRAEHREALVQATVEEAGRLDILVNSAGILEAGSLESTTADAWDRSFDINLRSLFALTQLAAPHIIRAKGSILNLSSVAGLRPYPGLLAYCVSKAAVDQLTRCLALEMAPHGVRVNALSAGPLKTLASSAVGAKDMESLYAAVSPLARNVTHDEVGRVGAFLLSPMSDGITAEIVHVDAGYNAMGSPGRLLDQFKS